MDVHELDRILLASAAVLLVAILAVRLSTKVGLPSLLVYLGIGMLLGDSGPGGIPFNDAQLAHALGFAALVIILTDGGLTTRWNEVRPVMPLGVTYWRRSASRSASPWWRASRTTASGLTGSSPY